MSMEKKKKMDMGPMLNVYPDSIGSRLSDMVSLISHKQMADAFSACYILPSLFNTDLDRGFSVIDYELNELLATKEDLEKLRELGLSLKLDFVLNHASVLSKPFQDMIEKGKDSEYCDFFIDWNKFWEGKGSMTAEGYLEPYPELIQNMFFRKSGLPILMVRMPDGSKAPYWNTFYQEVRYPVLDVQEVMKAAGVQYLMAKEATELVNREIAAGKKPQEIAYGRLEKCREAVTVLLEQNITYLGQMDLNIQSPLVWEYYKDTLERLAGYGAKVIRLDAFAYAPKEPGARNFLNEPGTWDLLEKVQELATQFSLQLLPEIHATYEEGIYKKVAKKGYMTYDFFLPGLIIDALENGTGEYLCAWARELWDNKIMVVNMLGCHDGIPLLDLRGMLPEERIQKLIDTVVKRGGMVKNLHGQKNVYYQVNATYFSALGESEEKMLLARAIQMFMPGRPQVWYLDLFAGKNDCQAVLRAGEGGHKEINRTNLDLEDAINRLEQPVVEKQLEMLKLRRECPAFDQDAEFSISTNAEKLSICWEKDGAKAILDADLKAYTYEIKV